MEEWIIIILLIIFVIMFLTLKPVHTKHSKMIQCYNSYIDSNTETNVKDLVMLPNPNPIPLTLTR